MNKNFATYVFVLWKARSKGDFCYYAASGLRGVIRARGLNEARFLISTKYWDEISLHNYDRLALKFGAASIATSTLTSPKLFQERMEKYGY